MRQFIPAPIIKDIADSGLLFIYKPNQQKSNPKEAIMGLWASHRDKLAGSTDNDLLNQFEQDIFQALGPQKDRSKGQSLHSALSKYQIQSENGLMGLWVDFFDFIESMPTDPGNADMSWLRLLGRPEKFCQYFETDKRYVMHGFRNQALISKAIADRSVDTLKPIIILKEDFEKLLDFDFDGDPSNERNYKFEKTNFVLNKIRSLKSLTSILAPYKKEAFVTAKNSEWKGEEPTEEQIDKYKLRKQVVTHFSSKPVWLVDDMKWMLSLNQTSKLNELIAQRNLEEPQKFGGLDNANSAVNHYIQATSNLLALRVQNGSQDCYKPLEDALVFNQSRINENPWSSLANYSAILSQSTCHITGRDYQKTDKESSLIEILQNQIIGHNAVMQLYHHLQDINMGYLSPDDESSLEAYHAEFSETNSKLFSEIKSAFITDEKVKFKNIEGFLKTVSEIQQLINTGMFRDEKVDHNFRQASMKRNVEKYYKPTSKDDAPSVDI
jgi:hypothetical protein